MTYVHTMTKIKHRELGYINTHELIQNNKQKTSETNSWPYAWQSSLRPMKHCNEFD